ncbi:MAG: RagB/SusD family nutrient uptake outer membrane protein [Bacteroidales bacterium]
MNTPSKTITLLSGLVLLLSSCDDFLEPTRDNRLFEEQVFNNPVYAEGLLLNAYSSLPTSYSFEDVTTDNAVTNDRGSNLLRMATGEWKSSFNPFSEWNNAYNQIYYINLFLEKLHEVEWSWEREEINQLYLKRLKGEAYGLRAWYEFQLLQSHAGLTDNNELLGFPIVTEVLTVEDDLALPRDTYEACLQRIMNDCDTAIANLTDEYEDTDDPIYDAVYGDNFKNRINATVVRALVSRVALHAASPAFTVNLSEAEKQQRWETSAMNAGVLLTGIGGPTGLSPTGHLFYLPQTSPLVFDGDIIWRSDYVLNNTVESQNYPPSLFGQGRTNPSQNLVDAFPMANGYPITHPSGAFDESAPYANRDPRLDHYIVYNLGKIRNISILTLIGVTKDGNNATTESTRTGYYLKKLMNPNANVDPTFSNDAIHFYTYFRYTEIFLNYAEAANEAWGPDGDPNGYGFTAKDVIAAIRSRAGIDQPDNYLSELTTREELRELIRNERRLELSFEGFRFWDLRRWAEDLTESCRGVFVTLDGTTNYDYQEIEKRNYEPYMIYGPIPYNETLIYDLTQNKGW